MDLFENTFRFLQPELIIGFAVTDSEVRGYDGLGLQ